MMIYRQSQQDPLITGPATPSWKVSLPAPWPSSLLYDIRMNACLREKRRQQHGRLPLPRSWHRASCNGRLPRRTGVQRLPRPAHQIYAGDTRLQTRRSRTSTRAAPGARAPVLECPNDRNGNPGEFQYYPGYQLVNSACPALGIPTPQTMLQFGDVLRQRGILAASAFRAVYDTRTGEIQFPANRRELPGFLPDGSSPDFSSFPQWVHMFVKEVGSG